MQKSLKPFLMVTFLFLFISITAILVSDNFINVVNADSECCRHSCDTNSPNKCEGNKVFRCGIGPDQDCDDDIYNDWCEIQDCSVTGQLAFSTLGTSAAPLPSLKSP